MFDWADDPITKLDLFAHTILVVLAIYGALNRHREKTADWLPKLLRSVRDERG